jgi:parallel beta-helix repeat protein
LIPLCLYPDRPHPEKRHLADPLPAITHQGEDMNKRISMRTGQLAASIFPIICFCLYTPAHAQQLNLGTAAAPQLIKCGDTISQAGFYQLGAPCTNFAGNAITIRAGNVALNLGGLTISGPGISSTQCKKSPAVNDGIVVMPPGADGRIATVNIQNGRIEGFVNGISLMGTDGAHLQSLTLTRGCNGLLLQEANASGVHDNTISDNLSQGVLMNASYNNWIHHNYVNGNGINSVSVVSGAGGGFLVVGSNRNLIGGNDIVGNGNYGIALTSPTAGGPAASGSNGNELVKNNVSSTKSGPGMRIGVGDTNIVADNITNSNSADGIVIQSADNLVQQNTANNNLDHGILANGPGAVGNSLRTNTARGNRVDLQDDNLLSCVNTWKKNTFALDSESGAGRGPGAGCIQ